MNEKYLKIINDRQLVSVMNKTKWRELCDEFGELHSLNISIRYKLISSNETLGFSPVWWDELFEESTGIEWLDFNPIVCEHRGRLVSDKETDRSDEILSVLKDLGIKYSIQESYFRVWGYLSQDAHPQFV
ncbi:hypothetical protein N474_25400 [Pseudoalteromonas luteoviolacea CPMOR-2]|uniref:DUF6678 family protein n=1 Tax=Pseudoalteromonas luteoviolacea TaxID=43657 RepID=UPI0007B0B89A|nr:DUF6678 family protein [Pseudoalteromonas luteoviolacea]KZN58928.1 hypothetical protein N474_25400 [Pseudoalteromonas luteoviolacea CPMOR-2]